jgi:hypothetical protein
MIALTQSLTIAIATAIFSDRDQCHGGNGKLVGRTKSKSKIRYV